jgi:hypothetical protein
MHGAEGVSTGRRSKPPHASRLAPAGRPAAQDQECSNTLARTRIGAMTGPLAPLHTPHTPGDGSRRRTQTLASPLPPLPQGEQQPPTPHELLQAATGAVSPATHRADGTPRKEARKKVSALDADVQALLHAAMLDPHRTQEALTAAPESSGAGALYEVVGRGGLPPRYTGESRYQRGQLVVCKLLGLLIGVSTMVLLGAIVLGSIEKDAETAARTEYRDYMLALQARYQISSADLDGLATRIGTPVEFDPNACGSSDERCRKWGLWNQRSWTFSFSIVSTIGNGAAPPSTTVSSPLAAVATRPTMQWFCSVAAALSRATTLDTQGGKLCVMVQCLFCVPLVGICIGRCACAGRH